MTTPPSYRIVCVNKTASPGKTHSSHITKVGTGTISTTYTRTWTVLQVRAEITLNQARFYTLDEGLGKVADVEQYDCCGVQTLRSKGDITTKNNLDNLGACAAE
jgi:hypothetical protein